jgi:hypothetical protein
MIVCIKKECSPWQVGDIDFFNFRHHQVWNFDTLNQSKWDQYFAVSLDVFHAFKSSKDLS